MSVSIYDIAKRANVSASTVSRALNDHPYIKAETKAHIRALAQEMGYVPSAVAQSLISSKTRTVGMVITTVADPVVVDILEGVEDTAQEAGYSVFLSTSRNDPRRELAVVETFQRRRVDGIIVIASRVGGTYSSRLEQIQVPIVLVENQEHGDYHHAVAVDNIGGASLAVEHLVALGHRRIGYVGAVDRPKSNDERFAGYRAALEQAGIGPEPALVSLPATGDDFERGRLGLAELLAAGASAVFCYNDRTAIGFMEGCDQHGLAIPEDISLVGFDDIAMISHLRPPLTTIRQPRRRMGQLAMRMALELIDGQERHDRILSCELVVRASTGVYKG